MQNGNLVISLDFELHWGIFDVKSVEQYNLNLQNTRKAIEKILELSEKYGIRLTFATVGFLFAKDKRELKRYFPTILPTYNDSNFSPYNHMNVVGEDEGKDSYHFALKTIEEIKKHPLHEISTHTFSHYYCDEEGQTIEQFDADIKAAIKIAKKSEIDLRSIVFPRNQVVSTYLNTCFNNNITSYRGNEKSFINTLSNSKYISKYISKGLRFIDSYINISGYHTHKILNNQGNLKECTNIPSSRFLRPYNEKLSFLEHYKIKRIKNAMSYASKSGEVFHLWWHPHNFGNNLEENIKNLEKIYKHYKVLNENYGFGSQTMTSLTHIN